MMVPVSHFPGIPDNEEARLKSIYLSGLLDTRDDERFERLSRLAKRIFQLPAVLISLLDRDRQWLLACEGLGIRETPRTLPPLINIYQSLFLPPQTGLIWWPFFSAEQVHKRWQC